MPKENKKRGRREEKKRKRDEDTLEENNGVEFDHAAKRQRSAEAEESLADEDYVPIETGDYPQRYQDGSTMDQEYYEDPQAAQHEFYGLLSEDEQSYFKGADNMLALNQFADAEERGLFLESVWREANNKELKIANSQSCSRFMERLIRISTPSQLKALFKKFKGHFLFLVQHRFASHCCEALFLRSAPMVTEELVAPVSERAGNDEEEAMMEDLFLNTVEELRENMGYLMMDNFASHALRVLIVVLSGRPLEDTATSAVVKSKKKENVDVMNTSLRHKVQDKSSQRTVPGSFNTALTKIIEGTVGGLDTNYLRALATHPVGNPVMQLLLETEFVMAGKQKAKDEKSLYRKLIPDDIPEEGTQSFAFLKGLLYDPVGSRLLETIISNAPGKSFKALYRAQFKGNLATMIRNDVASFVVMRVLERLSNENLQQALNELCPEIPALLSRSRTLVIKTLIEQCRRRKVEPKPIGDAFVQAIGSPGAKPLASLLQTGTQDNAMSTERKAEIDSHNNSKRHASLLAQAMIAEQDSLRTYILDSLAGVDDQELVALSLDKTATHVVQASLKCDDEKVFRRQCVPKLINHTAELATHPIGSHVVDVLWPATDGLFFLRERVASELNAHERSVRDSMPGRKVWKNWMMDLYQRRKMDWTTKAKGTDIEQEQPRVKREQKKMTAIEAAREKYAAKKMGPNRGQTRQTVTAL